MSKVENVLVKDDGSFQAHNGDETITLSSDEKGESGKKVALPVIDTSCESEDDDLAELLQTLIDQRTTRHIHKNRTIGKHGKFFS